MPDMLWEMPALALALGYVLGSIPFGILLTRLTGAGDLRAIGSGNIGATNVLRTGRKGLAAATLLLDMIKGAAAVLIAEAFAPGTGPIAGAAAFLGHVYPIWLRFRGGKGVATFMGVVAALHWPAGLVYAAVWLGMLAAFRISSLAGIFAALSAPMAAALMGQPRLLPVTLALALIVLWKHSDNIKRLRAGTEPRIGQSGSKSNAAP
jgi:acyl phosphate:glycerol-3-phosphate acyltransferase